MSRGSTTSDYVIEAVRGGACTPANSGSQWKDERTDSLMDTVDVDKTARKISEDLRTTQYTYIHNQSCHNNIIVLWTEVCIY